MLKRVQKTIAAVAVLGAVAVGASAIASAASNDSATGKRGATGQQGARPSSSAPGPGDPSHWSPRMFPCAKSHAR